MIKKGLIDFVEDGLFEEIGKLSYLQSNDLMTSDGIPFLEMKQLLNKKGVIIDQEVEDFYKEVNFIDIDWEFVNDGSIKLHYLDENDAVFGKVEITEFKNIVFPDDSSIDERILSSSRNQKYKSNISFIPFDKGFNEMTVCLEKINNKIYNNLYLLSIYDPKPIPLNIGIGKYIDLLFQTKGFEYWCYAYLHPDSETREKLLHYIPQLFPNTIYPLRDF